MATKREALIASAEKSLQKGKADAALKDYLKVLEETPGDINVLNKVGDLFVRLNRNEESIPYFSRIADHYSKDGFFLKAIAIYKKINKLDPSRLDVYERLAELYSKQGLGMEAKSQYQVLADYYLKQDNLNGAISIYQKMVQADAANIQLHVKLADLFTQGKRIPEALKQYAIVATMLRERNAHAEAVQVYEKALKLAPDNVEILRALVPVLLETGAVEPARSVLRKALETTPRSVPLFVMAAEAALVANDMADARSYGAKAQSVEPENEDVLSLVVKIQLKGRRPDLALPAALSLADMAVKRGEARKALAVLQPVVKLAPDNEDLLKRVVDISARAGDEMGAVPYRSALAEIWRRAGKISEAAEALRIICRLQPDNAEFRSRLAHLEQAMAASAPPPAPDAPEAISMIRDRPAGFPSAPPARPAPPPSASTVAPAAAPTYPQAEEFEFDLADEELVEEAPASSAIAEPTPLPPTRRAASAEESWVGGRAALPIPPASPNAGWQEPSADAGGYEAASDVAEAVEEAEEVAEAPAAPPASFGLSLPPIEVPVGTAPRSGAGAVPPPSLSSINLPPHPWELPSEAPAEPLPAFGAAGAFGGGFDAPAPMTSEPPPPTPSFDFGDPSIFLGPLPGESSAPPEAPPAPKTPFEAAPAPLPLDRPEPAPAPATYSPRPEFPEPAEEEAPKVAPPSSRAAAAEVEEGLVEADVFRRYGLLDRAAEQLRGVLKRVPDSVKVREKLFELYLEQGKTGAARKEAEALKESYRAEGREDRIRGLDALLGDVSERPPEAPREKPPEKPPEKPLEKAAEKPLERVAEKPPERSVAPPSPKRTSAEEALADLMSLSSPRMRAIRLEDVEAPKPPAPAPPPSAPLVPAPPPMDLPSLEAPELMAAAEPPPTFVVPEAPPSFAAAFEEPVMPGAGAAEEPGALPSQADLDALAREFSARIRPVARPPQPLATPAVAPEPAPSFSSLGDLGAAAFAPPLALPVPEPTALPEAPPSFIASPELFAPGFEPAPAPAEPEPPAEPTPEELAEIDFCLEQGMVVDAAERLQTLEGRFPGNAEIHRRRQRLEGTKTIAEESRPALGELLEDDLESVLDAELGRALTDEMARETTSPGFVPATEAASTVRPDGPAEPAIDESGLFSDEADFFNFAEELQTELNQESQPKPELEMGAEVSLEEIFREFKKGVEQQLSPEDYETHYNLGIAYKEMGLTDEAIGEFQIAAKDPAHAVECCSMLGLCFLEKGLAPLAIKWYRKGLETPGIRDDDRLGLQYDLASVYADVGDRDNAYKTFLDIYGTNASYRDVGERMKQLAPA